MSTAEKRKKKKEKRKIFLPSFPEKRREGRICRYGNLVNARRTGQQQEGEGAKELGYMGR